MQTSLHHLILNSADLCPDAAALQYAEQSLNYDALAAQTTKIAHGLLALGLAPLDRVAIYLPKNLEATISLFACSMAGGIFVPVNPQLKPQQVCYIANNCGATIMVTTFDRAKAIMVSPPSSLKHIIITQGNAEEIAANQGISIIHWDDLSRMSQPTNSLPQTSETDTAAILYTSGSTGSPKGVMLSHKNLLTGARSVSQYLGNSAQDKILSVLPISFDYGLSQLTTAFHSQASVVLLNYMLPREALNLLQSEKITGLAAVPSLWTQLAHMEWPEGITESLRYITNSGGSMPTHTLKLLQKKLNRTEIFLMYGLTEAFRSTFLPPAHVATKPTSIGKAIPNTEILIVNSKGEPCRPNEEGELVHRGPLVAQGYWGDSRLSAVRFRPPPAWADNIRNGELSVWSGDRVIMDNEGDLYFIGRDDDMIKSHGYRVSPTEIEDAAYSTGLIKEAVAYGKEDTTLGQVISLAITPASNTDKKSVLNQVLMKCKHQLPAYMVPKEIIVYEDIPYNANGKIDRKQLAFEANNKQTSDA